MKKAIITGITGQDGSYFFVSRNCEIIRIIK